jgi:hypothetical protein
VQHPDVGLLAALFTDVVLCSLLDSSVSAFLLLFGKKAAASIGWSHATTTT